MKKSFYVFALATMIAVTAMSSLSMAGQYKKAKLRMSCNGTDMGTDSRICKLFIQKVSDKSDGAIKIQLFNNDLLASGNPTKGIELLCDGTVDLDIHAINNLSNLDVRLMASTIPWLFEDYQAAEDCFFGKGGEFLAKALAPKGLTYLGAAGHNGLKAMTNSKHPIKKPEDLKGLKMRIPGGDLFAAFYTAFGASPQAMGWGEVFTALQQGTIDGHDNSLCTINSANVQEVQKYITISRHFYEGYPIIMNTKKYNSLPAETQQLLRECAAEACKEQNQILIKEEDELMKKFTEVNHCEIYVMTPEDKAAFKAVAQPVIDKFKEIYGPEACEAFGVK